MEKIAIIGAGLIGRAWAIVFARARHEVAIHDADRACLAANLAALETSLEDLRSRAAHRVAGRGAPPNPDRRHARGGA